MTEIAINPSSTRTLAREIGIRRDPGTRPDSLAVDSKPRSWRTWKSLVKFAFSFAVLGYLGWTTNWTEVGPTLTSIRPEFFGAACMFFLASQAACSRRWADIARAAGIRENYPRFARLFLEGSFFNLFLPTSIGGDVARALKLAPDAGGRARAAGTVLADRLLGLVALLVVGAAMASPNPSQSTPWPTLGLGVAYLGVAWLALRVAIRLGRSQRFRPEGANSRFRFAKPVFDSLASASRQPGVLEKSLAWSFVVQMALIGAVAMLGVGLGLNLQLGQYAIIVPTATLLATLPVSFGGMGVREGSLAILLVGQGGSAESGVALGIAWYLMTLVSGLLGGVSLVLGKARNVPAE